MKTFNRVVYLSAAFRSLSLNFFFFMYTFLFDRLIPQKAERTRKTNITNCSNVCK